jgi:transposase
MIGYEPTESLCDGSNRCRMATNRTLVPVPKPGGRPTKYPRHEIVNAIFYLLHSGGSWRLLSHDFPLWRILFYYFWSWRKAGIWEQVHGRL